MTSLNDSINSLKESVDKILGVCMNFNLDPSDEKGEKIIEIIEESEKKLLTVKKEIVIMVKEMKEEESFEVEAVPSKNGFILNKE